MKMMKHSMKKNRELFASVFILFAGVTTLAQSPVDISFQKMVDRLDTMVFKSKVIFVKDIGKITRSIPNEYRGLEVRVCSESELRKKVKGEKKISVLALIVESIGEEIAVRATWYQLSKKRRKFYEGIEGSVLFKYEYNCEKRKYLLLKEKAAFH